MKEPFGKAAKSKFGKNAAAVQLALKCRPGAVAETRKKCDQLFLAAHADFVLGQQDILLDLSTSRMKTWGEFIDKLLAVRADPTFGVLDTTVVTTVRLTDLVPQGFPVLGASV